MLGFKRKVRLMSGLGAMRLRLCHGAPAKSDKRLLHRGCRRGRGGERTSSYKRAGARSDGRIRRMQVDLRWPGGKSSSPGAKDNRRRAKRLRMERNRRIRTSNGKHETIVASNLHEDSRCLTPDV